MLAITQEARAEAARTGDAHQRGRQMVLSQAISLIAQQAEVCGMNRGDVGLDAVNPEQDLP